MCDLGRHGGLLCFKKKKKEVPLELKGAAWLPTRHQTNGQVTSSGCRRQKHQERLPQEATVTIPGASGPCKETEATGNLLGIHCQEKETMINCA